MSTISSSIWLDFCSHLTASSVHYILPYTRKCAIIEPSQLFNKYDTYSRSVRKAIRLYGRILWRTRHVISLMILNLFLFAALAKVLFYSKYIYLCIGYSIAAIETDENKLSFGTFSDTLYNLFVMQTTSNYPDIMMPAFRKHRYSIIFFAAFLISNYFLLFNLIIATFYYNFKTELQDTLKQIVQKESLAL